MVQKGNWPNLKRSKGEKGVMIIVVFDIFFDAAGLQRAVNKYVNFVLGI